MKQVFTLEEQIEGLKEILTVSPQQFAVKHSILETLAKLKSMRDALKCGAKINEDNLAKELVTVLGERWDHRRS